MRLLIISTFLLVRLCAFGQLFNPLSTLISEDWVVYSADDFTVKFPDTPKSVDTLGILFLSPPVADSAIELSAYTVEGVYYQFQNEFENAGVTSFDSWGQAIAKTLLALYENSELVSMSNVSLNGGLGLDRNLLKGVEIVFRYYDGERFILEFIRVFEGESNFYFFSVSGIENYVHAIAEYKIPFFNSIKFNR